jgi:uncharacterized membrane protein (DUF106 family)
MGDIYFILHEFSLIILFALIPALLSAFLNRLLISRSFGIERYRRIMREIRDFDKQLLQAARSKDNSKLEKLQAKKPYIDKMRSQTFKITMISTMIMLLFYYVFFVYLFVMIFKEPFDVLFPIISSNFSIPLYYWYIICLMLLSLLINRKIGIYY